MRSAAYRACVCMTDDSNPFTEFSALWKNFTGCAACVQRAVRDVDVEAWVLKETLRLRAFCRAQEPNAFLFLLHLRNWYYRLSNYSEISARPFRGAFPTALGDGEAAMEVMRSQWTGRPPLGNIAWGPSAPPDGKYSAVSPVVTDYVTIASVQQAEYTTQVSSLVSWVPTKAGVTSWNEWKAEMSESVAGIRAVQSALCLNKSHTHGECEISGARRVGVAFHGDWGWVASVAVAAVFGAAVWL